MAKYRIEVIGCDDSTTIEFDLDTHEVPLLCEIADKINEAAAGETCMPRMTITEIK